MNTYYVAGFPYSDELYHHGTKGQKWGIRRYQNPDGTLTEAGKERYRKGKNDYTEKSIIGQMDKYAKRGYSYDLLAKTSKEKFGENSAIYKHFLNKGKQYTNAVNTGAMMLRSYRSMTKDFAKSINEGQSFFNRDTRYAMEAIKYKSLSDMFTDNSFKNMSTKEKVDKLKKTEKDLSRYY